MIYHSKVIKWADEKGLICKESVVPQFKKLFEEVGELVSAVTKQNRKEEIDAFGDIQVVLIIFCEQFGLDYPLFNDNPKKDKSNLDLEMISELGGIADDLIYNETECIERDISDFYQYFCYYSIERQVNLNEALEVAWKEIEHRKGKKINGSFVRDKD